MKLKTIGITGGVFGCLVYLLCIAVSLVIPTLIVLALLKYIKS